MTDLLPCPFCGKDPEIRIYSYAVAVECAFCLINLDVRFRAPHSYEEEVKAQNAVIERWNIRANVQPKDFVAPDSVSEKILKKFEHTIELLSELLKPHAKFAGTDNRNYSGHPARPKPNMCPGPTTLEDPVDMEKAINDAAENVKAKPDSDGWIVWNGGGNPAPGLKVDIRFRIGDERQNEDSDGWNWQQHNGASFDIVKFRIAKPEEE